MMSLSHTNKETSVPKHNAKNKSSSLSQKLGSLSMKDDGQREESLLGDDLKPIENTSDIFARRLRALRKRLNKIEKNEELLAQKETEAKFKKAQNKPITSSTESSIALNADQLKAIEKKEALIELIKEIEYLNEQVAKWEGSKTNAKQDKNKQNKKKPPSKETEYKDSEGIKSELFKTADDSKKEIILLWIALCRLEAVSSTLLSPREFEGLRSLYAIIHSIVFAKDHMSGINEIVLWIHGSPNNNFMDVLPSYETVKYCVSKILSASFDGSKLPPKFFHDADKIEKREIITTDDLKSVSHERTNSSADSVISNPPLIDSTPSAHSIPQLYSGPPSTAHLTSGSSHIKPSSSHPVAPHPQQQPSSYGSLTSNNLFMIGSASHIVPSYSTLTNAVGIQGSGFYHHSISNSYANKTTATPLFERSEDFSGKSYYPSTTAKVINSSSTPAASNSWAFSSDTAILRAGPVLPNKTDGPSDTNLLEQPTSSSTTKTKSDGEKAIQRQLEQGTESSSAPKDPLKSLPNHIKGHPRQSNSYRGRGSRGRLEYGRGGYQKENYHRDHKQLQNAYPREERENFNKQDHDYYARGHKKNFEPIVSGKKDYHRHANKPHDKVSLA